MTTQLTGGSTSNLDALSVAGATTLNGATTIAAGQFAGGALTLGTAQNTTSGTSIDFTGIPSWVKRVTVSFNQVSTNGINGILLQLGSGSIVTTGYVGGIAQCGVSPNGATVTTGLSLQYNVAAALAMVGTATFTHMGGNIWVGASLINRTDGYAQMGNTVIQLSGVLDRIRLTTSTGVDTFDTGSINILYEG